MHIDFKIDYFCPNNMAELERIYRLFIECNQNYGTDTRKIASGVMFFCLKGGNFNGNLFQEEALSKGAAWIIGDEKQTDSDRLILVEDVLKTLQDLSRLHRRKMGVKLLGIGGSNGKTTTKELMVSVLSQQFKTHFTHGNLNNHIGVPMTLLNLREQDQISVVELGTNRAGDVEELCAIAEPDMGIITNIGKEHLEGFGSMEGVAKAEGELFEYLGKTGGHAFVNTDDELVKGLAAGLTSVTAYSTRQFPAVNLKLVPYVTFDYKGEHMQSNLPGLHNFQNIVAVIAVAEYLGMTVQDIKAGMAAYTPQNNRSQFLKGKSGNVIYLDAYNANPSSVEMAIRTLEVMEGQKCIVLGDMFELGAYEAREHQAIAELCAKVESCTSVLVGKAFAATQVSSAHVYTFAEKDQARAFLEKSRFENCTILLKGSRGMKMEDLLDIF